MSSTGVRMGEGEKRVVSKGEKNVKRKREKRV